MKNLLIMNRYSNPNNKKITSQCHVLDSNFDIVKSYPSVNTDDLIFFSQYEKVLIINVTRISDLSIVDILNKK